MEKTILTPEERKEKRAAKREKQRENNILRASKMHKVRLTAPHPPLVKSSSHQKLKYHIGCSGWFYWDWKGNFYPETLPTTGWFPYYTDHFETVEINASFYSWPTIATVKNWIKQAEHKNFVYTVKVCELITHIKKFTGTKEMVKDFSYIADILGDRMGCFLYQLPPSYKYTPARLKTIITQLQNGYKNVVEFRHQSWWNENVYDAFEKSGIIFCSCSAPHLPDELIKTADDIYIRFHGKKSWYRYNYSDEELQIWAERILKSKVKNVWIYFNNDYDCHAINNAKTLSNLLHV